MCPKSLPAWSKQLEFKIKHAGVGFDWEEPDQVLDKVKEELYEFHQKLKKVTKKILKVNLVMYYFHLINYARFIKVDPESALERTNKKFIKRFQFIEEAAKKEGKQLTDMSLS